MPRLMLTGGIMGMHAGNSEPRSLIQIWQAEAYPQSEASPCFLQFQFVCPRRTRMKCVALLLFLSGWLVPLASAQEHFQLGAYGDYFRISQTKTNMAGLGARAGIKAFSHVMLEGEMNYDFEQAFTEGFTNPSNPSSVTFVPSNLRVLHGLFGPKIVAGHGAIRP